MSGRPRRARRDRAESARPVLPGRFRLADQEPPAGGPDRPAVSGRPAGFSRPADFGRPAGFSQPAEEQSESAALPRTLWAASRPGREFRWVFRGRSGSRRERPGVTRGAIRGPARRSRQSLPAPVPAASGGGNSGPWGSAGRRARASIGRGPHRGGAAPRRRSPFAGGSNPRFPRCARPFRAWHRRRRPGSGRPVSGPSGRGGCSTRKESCSEQSRRGSAGSGRESRSRSAGRAIGRRPSGEEPEI